LLNAGFSTRHSWGKESPPPEETARLPDQAARSAAAALGRGLRTPTLYWHALVPMEARRHPLSVRVA